MIVLLEVVGYKHSQTKVPLDELLEICLKNATNLDMASGKKQAIGKEIHAKDTPRQDDDRSTGAGS